MSRMGFRRSRWSLFIVALTLVLLGAPGPMTIHAATEAAAAGCSERSWIGGTSEWCDGWFVHRDYVYDDYGADVGPGPTPEGAMVADLTSHACSEGHRQEVTLRRDAGTDPVPWIGQQGVASGPAMPAVPGERISGTLTNVAGLFIDLDKACLAPGADIDLDIRTDGPTVVRFSDHRPATLLDVRP